MCLRHRLGRAESRVEVVVRRPVLGYWDRLHRLGFDVRLLVAQPDHDLHILAADFAVHDKLAVQRQSFFVDGTVIRAV